MAILSRRQQLYGVESIPGRMSSIALTVALARPSTLILKCHCGASGLNYGSTNKPSCCWRCRCDEHLGPGHDPKSYDRDGERKSPPTVLPGCGPRCRVTIDRRELQREPMPAFEDWVGTNGGAAIRAASRSHGAR